MLDDVFASEVERFGITLSRKRWMAHQTFLTAYPWGAFLLSYRGDLAGAELVQAVGVQVARIALGQDFQRSGWKDGRQGRRDWDAAFRWLARRLISDRMMSRASRLGYDAADLAEECDVTDLLAWYRFEEWTGQRGQVLQFARPPAIATSEENC